MRLKKIWSVALAAALIFTSSSFMACSDSSGNGSDTTSDTTSSDSFDYSAALTDDGHFKDIKASDYVTLPTYKGVSIPSSVFTADDADLQEQVDSIISKYNSYAHITDRAVADGDTLNIDYVGKVDGVEFEGGSTNGAGTDVTIGTTQYIDDFLEQLIGHMPAETFDIEVTFPDPYENNTDLSGKDAVFTVTINYIQGDAITVELSDKIATDYGFTTKDELIADIKDWLITQQKIEFFNNLMADIECSEMPEAVYNYVKNSDIAQYQSYADSYSMDINTFMSTYMGYDTLEAYVEANKDTYTKAATNYLIVLAIADAEGLTATDADVTEGYSEDNIKTYGSPYLKLHLLENQIIPNFVADNGVVTEDTTVAE